MKIDRFSAHGEYRILISNFLYLTVLQGVNYILPFLTLPYLVRVIGVANFGIISFSSAIVNYFAVITDYGFNLSATRQIALYRAHNEKVIEIYSSIMIIKFMLCLLSFILMLLCICLFDKLRLYASIYILTFGSIVGQILFPTWFFQGMENMKYITWLNLVCKTISTIFIFIFVHSVKDTYLVPLITSSGMIVGGFISIYFLRKKFNIKFKFQKISVLIWHLKDGWYLFLTSIQATILSSSSVFFLGIFCNNTLVGYYSAIERLIKAFIGLSTPITQTIFPFVSKKLYENKKNGLIIIKKFFLLTMCFFGIATIIIIIESDFIIKVILGSKFIQYHYIMQYLSIWVLLSIANNFIGTQYLSALGATNYYFRSFAISGITTTILFITLIPMYEITGVIISILAGEVSLLLLMIYTMIKYKI